MLLCNPHCLSRTDRINAGLKLAVLLAVPVLFGLWLGLGIFGSALVALGYGFFTPWIATFEAFRQESEAKKFVHGIVVRHLCIRGIQVLRLLIMTLPTDKAEMVLVRAGRDVGHDQGQLHGS